MIPLYSQVILEMETVNVALVPFLVIVIVKVILHHCSSVQVKTPTSILYLPLLRALP